MRHMERSDNREGQDGGSSVTAVEALRRAISPEALKLLIEAGADVNARDDIGCTAMHWVAHGWDRYFDPGAMLKVLIDAGADADARNGKGCTPLMALADSAVKNPRALEGIKCLLATGADYKAENVKGLDVSYWLWVRRFDKLWENLLRTNLCKAMCGAEKKANVDLLTVSCWGSAAEIESALSHGADVNARTKDGYTPLMFASAFNTMEAVQFLIDRGADVNAKSTQNRTALLFASMRDLPYQNDPDVVRALVEAGADVNARGDDGNTPLSEAVQAYGTDEIAVILIEAGADVETKGRYGYTALRQAMRCYNLKAAMALLAAGADPKNVFDDKREDEAKSEAKDKPKDDENSRFEACLRSYGLAALPII